MPTKHTVDVWMRKTLLAKVRIDVEVADVDEGNCEDLTPDEIRRAGILAENAYGMGADWEVENVEEVKS